MSPEQTIKFEELKTQLAADHLAASKKYRDVVNPVYAEFLKVQREAVREMEAEEDAASKRYSDAAFGLLDGVANRREVIQGGRYQALAFMTEL